MRTSIRRLRSGGLTLEEAIARIEAGTRRDAEAYRQELAHNRTELRFVPLGSTYFNQERWLDDEDAPTTEGTPTDVIRSEIDRLRGR